MANLKVIDISTNCNSFGLHGIRLMGDDGTLWTAMQANDYRLKPVGTVIRGIAGVSTAALLTSHSYECPELRDDEVPMELVKAEFSQASNAVAAKPKTI